MKKLFLLIAFCLFTLFSTSCKSEPKAETIKEAVIGTDQVRYICPMDCEKGKTYTDAGLCPVCKMELVAMNDSETPAAETPDHTDHDGHSH